MVPDLGMLFFSEITQKLTVQSELYELCPFYVNVPHITFKPQIQYYSKVTIALYDFIQLCPKIMVKSNLN